MVSISNVYVHRPLNIFCFRNFTGIIIQVHVTFVESGGCTWLLSLTTGIR